MKKVEEEKIFDNDGNFRPINFICGHVCNLEKEYALLDKIDKSGLRESDIFHVGFKTTLFHHFHDGFYGIFLVLFVGMRFQLKNEARFQ